MTFVDALALIVIGVPTGVTVVIGLGYAIANKCERARNKGERSNHP